MTLFSTWRPPTWWVLGVFGVSGLLWGLGLRDPAFAAVSWGSPLLMAAALTWTRSWRVALVGLFCCQMMLHWVGFPYAYKTVEASLGFGPAVTALATLAIVIVLWPLPWILCTLVGYALARGRIGVRFWLPVTWVVGEHLGFLNITLNINNWLVTQWQADWVLRVLAQVGWVPTVMGGIFIAACVGQALAERQVRMALPGLALLVAALFAPPIESRNTDLLRGIGAIHTGSTVEMPHRAPPGEVLDLIIWPEAALHLRPRLSEGPGHGVQIHPLLPDTAADHLIGLVTPTKDGDLQNQVLAIDSDGEVLKGRAKRLLFPGTEKQFFWVGRDTYLKGNMPPFLRVGARNIISLICGEFLARSLVEEGARAGGELMIVVARDSMMVGDIARQQLTAIQVLRSVEYGVPSVRASHGGYALFVSSDGRVLAQSVAKRNGFLMWDEDRGARDVDFYGQTIAEGEPAPTPAPNTAVLYSQDAPALRARCPEGRCSYHAIEGFECREARAASVIIAGHGQPPTYLSRDAETVAAAVRCFEPELVVIDTCYGASSGLLASLGDLEAVVVAAPSLLPFSGLGFEPEFFTSEDPERRAVAVRSPLGGELLRWRVDQKSLAATLERVESMDATTLGEHIARRSPAEVKVPLGKSGSVLVPVDWTRVRSRAPDLQSERLHRLRELRRHRRQSQAKPPVSP